MTTELSVVIPLYNEEENVHRIETELIPELEKLELTWEIVTVDDGSRDRTKDLLAGLQERNHQVKVVRHETNRGLGAALRTGISSTTGEWIVALDGDFTFHPTLIRDLLRKQRETGVDCVIGSPLAEDGGLVGVPWRRALLTRVANFLYRRILGLKVTSVTAIFRLYRGEMLRKLKLKSDGFPINAEILAGLRDQGATVVEVPANLTVRSHGESKADTRREIFRHLRLMAMLACGRRGFRLAFLALSLFLVSFLTFLPTLGFDFLNWDDDHLLTNHSWYSPLSWNSLYSMWNPLSLWRGEALDYSPIRDMTYVFDYILWGWNPTGFHLTQIIVHSANAALFFLLLSSFTRIPYALCGALIWTIHPLVVEPVAWVSSRKDVVMAFFFFLALLFVERRKWIRGWLSGVAALLSKYVSISLGLVIYFQVPRKGRGKVHAIICASLLALAGWLVIYAIFAYRHLGSVLTGDLSESASRWPAGFQVISHAAWTMLWPASLSARYIQELGLRWSDVEVRAGILIAIAWLIGAVWCTLRGSKIGFGLLFLGLTFLPYGPWVPTNIWMADRYLYLPLAGLSMTVALVLDRFDRSRACLGVGILLLAVPPLWWQSRARLPVWRNSLALWSDTVETSPGLYYVWGNLAEAQLEAGEPRKAIESYRRAVALDPSWTEGWLRLAESYAFSKDLVHAQIWIAKFEGSTSETEKLRLTADRAVVWAQMGRNELAEPLFLQRLDRAPHDRAAWANLGILYAKTGREAKALSAWDKAIELDPRHLSARLNRARYWFLKHRCDLMSEDLRMMRTTHPRMRQDMDYLTEHCR